MNFLEKPSSIRDYPIRVLLCRCLSPSGGEREEKKGHDRRNCAHFWLSGFKDKVIAVIWPTSHKFDLVWLTKRRN